MNYEWIGEMHSSNQHQMTRMKTLIIANHLSFSLFLNHLMSGEYSPDGRRCSRTKSFTLLARSSALLKPSSNIDGLVERQRPSNSTKSFFREELLLLPPLLDSS